MRTESFADKCIIIAVSLVAGESFIAAAGTSPNSPAADCMGFSVPAGQWHNTECLESGTVFIECKDGAYAPLGPEDVLETQK